jgi:hypothetical protein
MYGLVPEKILRLVYEPFYLAINIDGLVKKIGNEIFNHNIL